MNAFTARLDRSAEKQLLARFTAPKVEAVLAESNKAGAKVAAAVLRSKAPIGTAARLSQFYRRMGGGHGAFRRSVRAAAIRGRGTAIKGLQGRTVGSVIGPMGKWAFTRAWIERGTARGERANPWVERSATPALAAAQAASEAVLTRYGRA